MPEFSRMVGAVTRSHMANDLRFAQNITIFAPTNAAMDSVSPLVADRIFPRDESGVREADPVLAAAAINSHIVPGRIPAAALAEGLRLVTMAGTPITIGNTPGAERGVTVSAGPNVSARVVQRDIPCANGMVHGIDRVLVR
ncbi:fasciclin domain-containing protein [Falsiroseomonas oryziterrae]|uniref:fasciclin domain-containing protein n=1 Tax=Falsiroseomonas oryziterrae TaxID=2911368 RepID=UPI001F3A1569|nr:fasciclin domain-containing protein [Roseomonas sp. NPKOSM-4]